MTNEEYQKIFKEMNEALYNKKENYIEKQNKDKIKFDQMIATEPVNKKKITDNLAFETQKEILKKQYNVFTKKDEPKKTDIFTKVVNSLEEISNSKMNSVELKEYSTYKDKIKNDIKLKDEELFLLEEMQYSAEDLEDNIYESESYSLEEYEDYNEGESYSKNQSYENTSKKSKKRFQRRENKKLRKVNIQKDIYNSITSQNTIFKKIGAYIFDRVALMKLSSEDKDQYYMAASFIEHNMLDKIVTMQSQGYELPNRLQTKFDEKMFELIQTNPLPIFERIIKEVGSIPKSYLLAATFSQSGKAIYFPSITDNKDKSHSNYYYNHSQMIIHKYPHINDYMKDMIQDKEFLNDLNNFAVDVINHTSKIITTKNFSKQGMANKERIFNIIMQENKFIFDIPNIWQGVTLKEYLDVIKSFKESSANVQKELKYYDPSRDYKVVGKFNEIVKNINELINNMSNNVDKLYSSVITNNTTIKEKNENIEGNQKSITTYADLPKEAQELIKSLNENYSTIKNEEKNFLEIIDFDEVEIIISKRLPDIVKKYRAVHDKYKDNMLSIEGKNATQLVVESLKFLNKSLINYMEGINEAKVSSLSATKRHSEEIYQQSIKNGRTKNNTKVLNNGQEVELEIEESPDITLSGGKCRI